LRAHYGLPGGLVAVPPAEPEPKRAAKAGS
jgi:hypothetical protein